MYIFLLVSLSYLEKFLHVPDHFPLHRAVLHVVVDPACASVATGSLCGLLVDDDLRMVTEHTINEQFNIVFKEFKQIVVYWLIINVVYNTS